MKILSFAFLLLYMISCDDKKPSNIEDESVNTVLAGKWVARSLFLSDANTGVCHQNKTERDLTIEFAQDKDNPAQHKINGNAPVNDYFSSLEIISFDKETGIGKIKVGGVGGTKRAGPSELMECESFYYNFLSESTGFQIDPDEPNFLKLGRIKEPGSAPSRDGGTYYYFEKVK